MKFHLSYDNKISVCGLQTNKPNTFLYNEVGFYSHLAIEYRCKKCDRSHLLKTKNKLLKN